ncbi:MAG: tRNA pseudouridine(38-40) synthase TruA [Candidatus Omnitrophica bacterium]|nr:tRNA pseudouridine(38-40) synthase TruA [Candidatus Omnitrophota bacterium]
MRNIKLTIEYDGSEFKGWQIQTGKGRTVQGEITQALRKILKEDVKIIGSGRTDTGVHALAQVAHFKTQTKKSTDLLLKAINANLPQDISIQKVEEMDLNFHAQHSVVSKVYRYAILNQAIRSPLRRKVCYFFPFPLNINLMKTESQSLIGHHDFKSFQASDPAKLKKGKLSTTVRTIHNITFSTTDNIIYITIEGDGFLYKMVRNIVGTLIEIGHKNLPKGTLQNILLKKNRKYAAKTAPACGLTMLQVNYEIPLNKNI